jgi:conjugal transfer pilus assembly protein TraW
MHMRGAAIVCAALAVAAGAPWPVAARDLGAYGATFPIIEQDLLAVLAARLKAVQASGRTRALDRAFAARVKANVERPPAVADITHTTEPRSWLFDPTIEVPQDYADQTGRVFAHRGDRINPLERIPGFNRVLVFIDGDAPGQVAFALRRARLRPDRERVYIVLVAGAPLALMRTEKAEVYFDQQGLLTTHFDIRHVPAVVEKEGLALRVSELKP